MESFIAVGDNLNIIKDLPDKSIDLLYLDPLFNSSKIWTLIENSTKEIKRFKDIWVGGRQSYIYDMMPRIRQCYRILKDTGSILIHCDTNLSHYLKILLDEEFGENCFRNEIIWLRTQGQFADSYRTKSKSFGKQHDILLWFSKRPTNFKSKIIPFRLWSEEKIKKKFPESDEKGVYSWERQYSEIGKKFKERLENGELKKTRAGYYYKRYYEDSIKGYILSDTWIDIKPIPPNSKTKKWPTEKPEELFECLIQKLTDPGDIVGELYMGSAPACAVAAKLGRKFIGVDISPIAFNAAKKRLSDLRSDMRVPRFQFEEKKTFFDYQSTRNMDPFEFELMMINELAFRLDGEPLPNPPNKQRKDGKIDGFILLKNKMIPIQVKRQDKVDGNTVTITKEAIKNKSNIAYIIAFSFTREAKTFVMKYKAKENIDIKLIKVSEILNIVYPIKVNLHIEENVVVTQISNQNKDCESLNYSWIIFYNKDKNNTIIKQYSQNNQLNLKELKTFKRPFKVKCVVTDDCGGVGENIIIVSSKKIERSI